MARSRARASISSARVDWIKAKAQAATESRFNGAVVWKCIHDLQSCTRGLAPVRTSAVLDENGNICSSPEEQSHRWGRHFDGVLNVASAWNRNALDDIPQRQEADHLAEAPTLREVSRAISRLQNGKSAGASGILPEMLKRGGPDLTAKLVELFGDVWRAGVVPQEWVDATLVPIPKKGDLSRCDNWRGISLLDVVGKVLASVIQTRLQSVAADFLPESQCGFRRGRSCTDMVFSVRQFLEKTIEHDCKGFFVFIDLKKAYDSVPRDCLWEVLSRAGIPAPMLAVIRSFHTDMSAVVRVENTTTDPIRVTNGLRQGCTMAPVLFNIFMWAVVTVWQRRVRDVPGVGFEFRHCDGDNNLYRKPTRTDPVAIATESQFADDSALFATTRAGAETALAVFDTTAAEFGLKVSATKTQFLVAGRDVSPGDCAPIELAGTVIECVSEFRYLGSLIHRGGRSTQDITARIAHASRACGALQGTIFSNPDLDLHIKRCVFNACVLSLLLYGSECWTPLQHDLRRLSVFHMRCIRSILGVSRRDCWNNHTTNAQLLEMWGDSDTICVKVAQHRLEWLGHVARMDSSRMPRQILFGSLLTRRPAHGPRKRWKDCVVSDLRVRGLTKEWYPIACESRADWRTMYAEPVENVPQPDPVITADCNRSFSHPGDRARHKCVVERAKLIAEQRGACHCGDCGRWFRSKGGLAVHCCSAPQPQPPEPRQVYVQDACCAAHCAVCACCFRSVQGRGRHRCSRTGPRPTAQQRNSFSHVCVCSRRFRLPHHLRRHQAACSIFLSDAPPGPT